MENFVTAFHIDWKIILAQAINFGVVIFVLYRFAVKPLTKNLDERQATISKGLSDADENAKTLAETKLKYEEALKEARIEGAKMIEVAKKDAEKKKKELMEKTDEELKQMAETARKNLETEKVKIMQQAEGEIAELVISSTKKVLGDIVTPAIDKKLIESTLS